MRAVCGRHLKLSPEFDPKAGRVGYVVDRVALREGFFEHLSNIASGVGLCGRGSGPLWVAVVQRQLRPFISTGNTRYLSHYRDSVGVLRTDTKNICTQLKKCPSATVLRCNEDVVVLYALRSQ
jgi:hypothetical protein